MTPSIPDSVNADDLRPDQDERTLTIPLSRRHSIGIERRPGWWVVLIAPLTIIIAVAVITYCAISPRGQL